MSSNWKFSIIEILQFTVLLCVLLYFGKTLLIPLSFAMLISFILYPVCKWMEKKGMSQGYAIFVSLFCVMLFMGALVYLLFTQIVEFSNEWKIFKVKILETVNQLSIFLAERFEVSIDNQISFIKNAFDNSGTQALSLVKITLYSISEFLFYLLIIPVYSALILYYRQLLIKALMKYSRRKKRKLSTKFLLAPFMLIIISSKECSWFISS